MARDLERLLHPDYLGDVRAHDVVTVRQMRADCQAVEAGLSLLRRMAQGRLDIVGMEVTRRAEGGDAGDLSELIARLPELLADRTSAPGVGRLPQVMAPGDLPPELEAELDAVAGRNELATLADQPDDVLAAMTDALATFEQKVSTQRRALFDQIDVLQAELTRRYRTGEATVDSLLA